MDGEFPLIQWLGSSGDSVVFVTELKGESPRKAAIKLLPADSAGAEARVAGWAAAAELSHPNLMRLFHAGRCSIDEKDWVYSVSEFAEEILDEIVAERPLSPHEIREMLGPSLDALAYLHEKGFVHGRIKPSNIVVVNDQLKISADLLLAAPQTGRRLTVGGPYDAPELSEGMVSPAADIWSLGVTLVKAETQQLPQWDRSANSDPVVPVPLLPPFAEIARECLRLDPPERCRIGEIKASLKTGAPIPNRAADKRAKTGRAENDQTRISQTGSMSEAPSASSRKVAIVAGAVVVIAVAALFALRSEHAKPSPATGETLQSSQAPSGAPAQPTAQSPASSSANAPAPAPTQTPEEAKPSTAVQSAPEPQTPTATPPSSAVPAAPSVTPGVSTQNGEVIDRVLPYIPAKANATIQGKFDVVVEVTVDAGGAVSNATLRPPEKSRYFSNLTLDAARKWKFKPAQTGGNATSRWILRFRFRQSGIEVATTHEEP